MRSRKTVWSNRGSHAIWYLLADDSYTMSHSHTHSRYEMFYVVDGEMDYFIRNSIYHIKTGDLILIDQNEIHSSIFPAGRLTEAMVLEFADEAVGSFVEPGFDLLEVMNGYSILHLDESVGFMVHDLLSRIMDESRGGLPGSLVACSSLIVQLLVLVSRCAERSRNVDVHVHEGQTYTTVTQIADYICSNYANDLSIESLSSTFYLSPYYMMRMFKKHTGFSIMNYVAKVRIREAARLLRNTDLSVTEIAGQVGFRNVTHFGRVFRQIMGKSPRSYRSHGQDM